MLYFALATCTALCTIGINFNILCPLKNGRHTVYRVIFHPFYFCPSIHVHVLAKGFAQFWICPNSVVLKEIYLNSLNSPNFKFAHWQQGKRGKNKAGVNISLYIQYCFAAVNLSVFLVSSHYLCKGCRYWNEIWYADLSWEYLGQVLFHIRSKIFDRITGMPPWLNKNMIYINITLGTSLTLYMVNCKAD